jgi:hypothetical protein
MRPAFALCLSSSLLICCFSMGLAGRAAAAPAHHVRPHHHGRSEWIAPRPAGGEYVPPGWYKFPGYPPIPPEENRNLDPSNFGGG